MEDGIFLVMVFGFEENLNVMMVLWKDYIVIREVDEINDLAVNWGGEDFIKYEGGIYFLEWFWVKILYVVWEDQAVWVVVYFWLEYCDLMINILIGNKDFRQLKCSCCVVGYKVMWYEDWGGLFFVEFLEQLDFYMVELCG